MFKNSELDYHANAATMNNTPALEQMQKSPGCKGVDLTYLQMDGTPSSPTSTCMFHGLRCAPQRPHVWRGSDWRGSQKETESLYLFTAPLKRWLSFTCHQYKDVQDRKEGPSYLWTGRTRASGWFIKLFCLLFLLRFLVFHSIFFFYFFFLLFTFLNLQDNPFIFKGVHFGQSRNWKTYKWKYRARQCIGYHRHSLCFTVQHQRAPRSPCTLQGPGYTLWLSKGTAT